MRLLLFAFALSGFLSSSGFGQMVASNDRVRVEVRAETDTDRKDLKGTTSDTITQNKSLVIRITGKAASPEKRVVKWTVFGVNVGTNRVTTLDSGQFPLSLDARGEQTMESKRVSTTYTPDHSVVSRNKSKGRNNRGSNRSTVKTTRVDAKGTKYLGYAVKVMDGTSVVGEISVPPGIAARAK